MVNLIQRAQARRILAHFDHSLEALSASQGHDSSLFSLHDAVMQWPMAYRRGRGCGSQRRPQKQKQKRRAAAAAEAEIAAAAEAKAAAAWRLRGDPLFFGLYRNGHS